MALIGIYEVILAFICFAIGSWLSNRSNIITCWPVVGMLPALLANVHRLQDWMMDIAERSGGTFHLKGPWFSSMDMVGTVDPANVKHILSTNFSNYPKGFEYKEMFDIFGDGIFNSDYDLWKNQRKAAVALINHNRFRPFLFKTIRSKLEKGLIPILEHVSKQGVVVDLQDLVHRYTLNVTIKMVTGFDPGTLNIELSEDEVNAAFHYVDEAIFYRHVRPKFFWKLQRSLGFGLEKKLKKGWEIMDRIAAKYIAEKRQQLVQQEVSEEEKDFLASYIMNNNKAELMVGCKSEDQFLRDTIFNLVAAGRENSTSWFFWLVLKNPHVEAKLIEELKSLVPKDEMHEGIKLFDSEELSKLVYLHATICETLRLYPPVTYEHKEPLKPDILPSGHHVDPNMKIVLSGYLMGRMKSIWGDDCLEFKPERWISKQDGRLIQHSPYKFIAFNPGPRSCIGKDIAFHKMKAIAAAVLYNYKVHVVEEQEVVPNIASILIHIKHGLMVKIIRRV